MLTTFEESIENAIRLCKDSKFNGKKIKVREIYQIGESKELLHYVAVILEADDKTFMLSSTYNNIKHLSRARNSNVFESSLKHLRYLLDSAVEILNYVYFSSSHSLSIQTKNLEQWVHISYSIKSIHAIVVSEDCGRYRKTFVISPENEYTYKTIVSYLAPLDVEGSIFVAQSSQSGPARCKLIQPIDLEQIENVNVLYKDVVLITMNDGSLVYAGPNTDWNKVIPGESVVAATDKFTLYKEHDKYWVIQHSDQQLIYEHHLNPIPLTRVSDELFFNGKTLYFKIHGEDTFLERVLPDVINSVEFLNWYDVRISVTHQGRELTGAMSLPQLASYIYIIL